MENGMAKQYGGIFKCMFIQISKFLLDNIAMQENINVYEC